jgi:hypothetical protein
VPCWLPSTRCPKRRGPPSARRNGPGSEVNQWSFRTRHLRLGVIGRRAACRGTVKIVLAKYRSSDVLISRPTQCGAGVSRKFRRVGQGFPRWPGPLPLPPGGFDYYLKVCGIATPLRSKASRWVLVGSASMGTVAAAAPARPDIVAVKVARWSRSPGSCNSSARARRAAG